MDPTVIEGVMYKASDLTHEPAPGTRKFAPGVHGAWLGGEDQEDASSKGSKEPHATTRLPQIIVIPGPMALPVPQGVLYFQNCGHCIYSKGRFCGHCPQSLQRPVFAIMASNLSWFSLLLP